MRKRDIEWIKNAHLKALKADKKIVLSKKTIDVFQREFFYHSFDAVLCHSECFIKKKKNCQRIIFVGRFF